MKKMMNQILKRWLKIFVQTRQRSGEIRYFFTFLRNLKVFVQNFYFKKVNKYVCFSTLFSNLQFLGCI
ncbi:hypothetical protein HanIR_Chr10g0500151 [Helianthus annuus]|nr:hypothetical protein HanIR_Chr10g0500151 [Helianthus annuus]